MLEYLLKFSASLAIFMVFYKLFLERENMHQLKRYYLLAVIFIALSIPLITFTTYVEPVISSVTEFQTYQEFVIQNEIIEEPTNYLPIILWSIYGLGVVLFGIKFILNLSKIVFKINRNPKHKTRDFTHVLLLDLITPHTFFNFIFLNKYKFETQQIPKEVFIHEEAHARQKHSIDVLLVELLQIVFWFNPLIYFTKQSIKMNHEFLADEAVLKQGVEPSNYQQLLLTFSSNVEEPELANAINYSSTRHAASVIKKRFTVMKTHTSKQKIWLRSFLLLPLIALTLFGFSDKKEVVKEVTPKISNTDTIQDIVIYISEEEDLFLNKNSVTLENLHEEINKLNTNLTKEQKRSFLSATIQYEDEKSQETIKKIYSILMKLNISSFSTSNIKTLKKAGFKSAILKNKYAGKTIEEAEKIYSEETIDLSPQESNDPNSPWQISTEVNEVTFVELNDDDKSKNVTQEMIEEYNAIVKDINSKPKDKKILKLKDVERLSLIYSQMSDEQRKSALPLPNLYENLSIDVAPPKTTNQNSPWQIGVEVNEVTVDRNAPNKQTKATPEEVEEYNKLIRDVNSNPKNQRIFRQKDVTRLEDIYKRMSQEQKANAEPFPNFPPLPPAPDAPKLMKGKDVPPPPPIPAKATPAEKKKMQATIDNYDNDVPPPPAPPAPKSPLDHVMEMAKKGATFYYEGKSISSDEAIQLLKKNNERNISTLKIDTDEPKVHISKEIEVPYYSRITPFKDKPKTVETTITTLVISTDNLDELKKYNWKKLKDNLSEYDPDTMVSIEFNFNKPVLFDGSKMDSFSHKISCRISELDDYISKSQRIISKLKEIK